MIRRNIMLNPANSIHKELCFRIGQLKTAEHNHALDVRMIVVTAHIKPCSLCQIIANKPANQGKLSADKTCKLL